VLRRRRRNLQVFFNGCAVSAIVFLVALLGLPGSASAAPWLFLSDIHFDPRSRSTVPSYPGEDTNLVLLRASIAEMKRVDPAPPVVVITGDFLAHHFDSSKAIPTMKALAVRFNAAFPQAQFVIALGNEDSACGDYALTLNAPFLPAVAAAWEPLVNRRGAAPAFLRTFSRDGFYTATLPIPHLRAVVIDDVFWSTRYHTPCGGKSAGGQTLSALRAALQHSDDDRHWIVGHIPPGIDAFSTIQLFHRLVVAPFLEPSARQGFLALANDSRSHVTLVLMAHTHKFSYRVDATGGTHAAPIFIIPAVSPIFANAPSFLTVNVRPDGAIADADDHAFLNGRWRDIGGTRTLGLAAVTAPELLALQSRLAASPALRATYARLYNAGARPEIDEKNWRAYWCTTTAFTAGEFDACIGHGAGISLITARGIRVIAVAALGLVALIAVAGALVYRFRRKRKSAPGS
jgi:sphingomyelin phosphodiesterase acid-like 3